MPNVKGQPRAGGRKPGSLNKRSQEFIDRLNECCERLGVDLVEAQVRLTQSEDEDVRQRALSAIYRHAYPALKAIEHSGEVETAPQGFRLLVVREGDNAVTPAIDSEPVPELPDPLG